MRFVAWIVKIVFKIFTLFPQQNKVVFLSRQSARPFDFLLLETYLQILYPQVKFVWACLPKSGRFGLRTMVAQLWHAATASVCFVDGYVPAISIPASMHRAFCVQVWHAPGAIKKFGYQSLDTPDGRSSRAADVLGMHRGYDCIVAGFPGARACYAEAFNYPEDKIVACGLPRMDYLTSRSYEHLRTRYVHRVERRLKQQGYRENVTGPVVLYAPTFRRSPQDPQWLERAVRDLAQALPSDARLVVSGHPIEAQAPHDKGAADGGCSVYSLAGIGTIHALLLADYVVTDYSTVAFEAGLLHKRVLFFTPDIDEYRVSPGLNIDPLAELPSITCTTADAVARVIEDDVAHGTYDMTSFDAFMEDYGRSEMEPSRSLEKIRSMISPYFVHESQDSYSKELNHGK